MFGALEAALALHLPHLDKEPHIADRAMVVALLDLLVGDAALAEPGDKGRLHARAEAIRVLAVLSCVGALVAHTDNHGRLVECEGAILERGEENGAVGRRLDPAGRVDRVPGIAKDERTGC